MIRIGTDETGRKSYFKTKPGTNHFIEASNVTVIGQPTIDGHIDASGQNLVIRDLVILAGANGTLSWEQILRMKFKWVFRTSRRIRAWYGRLPLWLRTIPGILFFFMNIAAWTSLWLVVHALILWSTK